MAKDEPKNSEMIIRIVTKAKGDALYRGGLRHAGTTFYREGYLKADQLKKIAGEKRLVLTRIPATEIPAGAKVIG